ncbi:MAG: glycosyltransferase, partial [Thermoanaerobaculia bacterium]
EERRGESIKAAKVLGLKEPVFFDFPDGNFFEKRVEIEERIKEILIKEKYDGIFCPSFEDFHKDHRTLSFCLIKILQSIRLQDTLQENLWNTSLYFYEIYQPQKINSLFDITDFIEKKKEAIKEFKSQLEIKDFLNQIIGLNSYRSFTLPKESKFAEGFCKFSFQEIQKIPITDFIKDRDFYRSSEIPISVIVRTKDRPMFLSEALNSLKSSYYPLKKIIIVNDGDMELALGDFKDLPLELIKTGKRGRSFAANEGIKKADTDFVSFLDDDDLIYPHHFNVLSRVILDSKGLLAYSDALSSIYEYGEEKGEYKLKDKVLSYSMDFDPDILLYDNYIPLNTILFSKELFKSFGYFNENLDRFEDWELLIRFSRKITFYHIKEITCEYRNFSRENTLGFDPSKDPAFQRYRMEILKLTKDFRTLEVEERVVKKLKDANWEIIKNFQILKGELWYIKEKYEEILREKEKYLAEMDMLSKENEILKGEREEFLKNLKEKDEKIKKLEREMQETSEHISATYNEIKRLNSILAQIYSSKIWKFHSLIQRIKGIFK